MKNSYDFTEENDLYQVQNEIKDLRLSKAILEENEYKYASELKAAIEENDLTKQALILQEIGNIYFHYAKQDGKGEDFTKAIALYNAAIMRNTELTEKNILITKIKKVEECFLEKIGKKNKITTKEATISYDNTHKDFLINLRDII